MGPYASTRRPNISFPPDGLGKTAWRAREIEQAVQGDRALFEGEREIEQAALLCFWLEAGASIALSVGPCSLFKRSLQRTDSNSSDGSKSFEERVRLVRARSAVFLLIAWRGMVRSPFLLDPLSLSLLSLSLSLLLRLFYQAVLPLGFVSVCPAAGDLSDSHFVLKG